MFGKLKRRTYKIYISLVQRIYDRRIPIGPSPVFIVGCGHSGTTLLVGLIGRHPAFHYIPNETYIFRPNRSFAEIKDFFEKTAKQAGEKRILEKTPRHVADMDRIFRIFPHARIIAMVRDGRDVACSMQKRDIPLQKAIRRWMRACKLIIDVRDNPLVHVVRYEDLVKEQEKTLNGIFAFLEEKEIAADILSNQEDIDWNYSWTKDLSEEDAENAQRREKHLQRRREQINKPIYDDTQKWRSKLSAEEINFLNREAADMLSLWGYGK